MDLRPGHIALWRIAIVPCQKYACWTMKTARGSKYVPNRPVDVTGRKFVYTLTAIANTQKWSRRIMGIRWDNNEYFKATLTLFLDSEPTTAS